MHLTKNELDLLAQKAVSAARSAGAIISQYSKKSVSVQKKTGGESPASQVVTKVDYLCQEAILKILLPTCEQFDLALLTEESEDNKKRLEKDYFWCIDPLDGTLPFIESTPGYAVSIALVSCSGSAVIGVVFDPVKQILYHAVQGKGAFLNNKPWQLLSTAITQSSVLTIVSDRSFLQLDYYTQLMTELENIALQSGFSTIKTIQYGGAVMNACWVLENSPACYFKFPKEQQGGGSLWDYAATVCIFNELGGIVADIYGRPLDLNRSDSCFMNHRGIYYAYGCDIDKQILEIYNILINS